MGSRSLGFGSRRDDQKMLYIQSPELLGPVSLLFIDYNYEDEDPFDDVEAQEELHELLDRISTSDTNCPVEEYIDGEGDVPTCISTTITGKITSLPTLVPHKQSWTHLSKRILMMDSWT